MNIPMKIEIMNFIDTHGPQKAPALPGSPEPACRIMPLGRSHEFSGLLHVLYLGNPRRHVVIVSHSKLTVSNSEHVCY